jgi:hypothetical protein
MIWTNFRNSNFAVESNYLFKEKSNRLQIFEAIWMAVKTIAITELSRDIDILKKLISNLKKRLLKERQLSIKDKIESV